MKEEEEKLREKVFGSSSKTMRSPKGAEKEDRKGVQKLDVEMMMKMILEKQEELAEGIKVEYKK